LASKVSAAQWAAARRLPDIWAQSAAMSWWAGAACITATDSRASTGIGSTSPAMA
jgi:hypothetical protein